MIPSRGVPARAMVILSFVGIVGFAAGAAAFVPPDSADHSVDRLVAPKLSPASTAAIEASLATSPAWSSWSNANPNWRVRWNPETRTAHRMSGPGARLAAPPTTGNIEALCRDFLVAQASLTGVRAEELRLACADFKLGRWYVIFEQVVHGIPVRGARADLRVGAGGEVLVFGSDFEPAVRVDANASVTAASALVTAATDIEDAATDSHQELVIVADPRGGNRSFRLAWEVRFRTANPPGSWLALVDAENGTLLRRQNEVRYANFTGNITAEIEPNTIGDPFEERPLRDTRFNVGNGVTEFGYTDATGAFDVTTALTDSANIRVQLSGRYGRVFNHNHGDAIPTIDTRMFPGTSRDFHWTDSNSRASERDAYYFELVAHQTIKTWDPSFTGVDYRMPIIVDIYDADCNAFYNGVGINFYGESGRCVNTARIADVVLHEYGHAITDRVYRPFAPSGAMHEGFSDFYAATITDQPLIGRGFRGPGTIIRTVDNTNRAPEDLNGEVHHDGLIIAGALWDLREAVGAAVANPLFHFARYGRADNFDDYMLDVLVTDDDNANIYDGTPHFNAIIGSFRPHGVGDYSVQIAHAPVPDTEDLLKPLHIATTIKSIFQLDPTSLQVYWAANGGAWTPQALTLVAGGGPRDFEATLPAQSAGTQIDYYITAADTAGDSSSLPVGGSAAPFTFRVGADVTPPVITHVALDDRPLDAPSGWPITAQVTDNLDHGLSSVVVHWSRNSGALNQLLPLASQPQARWTGALPSAGASLGDSILYAIQATDSATTPNVANAPGSGRYGFRVVAGFARDLEADDAGWIGANDWVWGVPVSEPAAYSGSKVWGTGVNGSYSDNTRSFLNLGTIDLSTWTTASLAFQSWFDTEPFYDGGNVLASTDGGSTWVPIVPSGGYPFNYVQELNAAGFSGTSNGWQYVEFDLSQFVGQSVALQFQFASDSGVVDRGWFVDDVEIVGRQVRSIPLGLVAQSGLDSAVPLAWQAPAGINPFQPGTPLLGYDVYRALAGGDFSRLNDTPIPITTAQYLDATAVNGQEYLYYVTGLYAAGPSAPSRIAEALPYVAGYGSDAVALYMPVPLGGAADTTVTFSNSGTGFLNMNVFLGSNTDVSLDAIRIAYTVPASGLAESIRPTAPTSLRSGAEILAGIEPSTLKQPNRDRKPIVPAFTGGAVEQLLFTDPAGDMVPGTTAPDWQALYATAGGGNITFKIKAYAAWGSPLADFNTILGFDVDANRGTGDANGEDLYVLIGPFALANFGVPAQLVTSRRELLGPPPVQLFPSGADSMFVGFDPGYLGGVGNRVYVSVTALGLDMQSFIDGMPNRSATTLWLRPATAHLVVPAGGPTPLTLNFPGGLPAGRYQGKIFLETNAPATPVAVIPVTYDYLVTAVEVQDLVAVQEAADVVVHWRTGTERDVEKLRVYRGRDGGPLEALRPDVDLESSRTYTWRDRDVEPGAYVYRIGEVAADGRVTLHGEAPVVVTARVPLVTLLEPAVPNPFNPTTTLRFGIATAGPADLIVYDARGRVVRTLWREAHAAPGFLRVTWDGRDTYGTRVASGVYLAALHANGRTLTRRLTLVK